MKVMLIDDHLLVAESLKLSLEKLEDIEEVRIYGSIEDAIAAGDQGGDGAGFEMILLDWQMPGLSGTAGVATMTGRHPGIPVVVVSGVLDPTTVREALNAGARGFLTKTMSTAQIAAACQLIRSGSVYAPPDLMGRPEEAAGDLGLNDREMEVVIGVARGLSNKEIGLELDLQEVTIKLHLRRAMRKLGVSNRTQAAMKARDLKLV